MQLQNPDKTFVLYKGKITIDFLESKHWYVVRETGKLPVSVTGATGMLDKSRPLMIWAERLAVEFLKNGLKGKMKLLERIIKSKEFDEDEIRTILFTEKEIEEACGQYAIKKQEAADIGTQVHAWIEQHIKFLLGRVKTKPVLPTNEKVLNGVTAFLSWANDHDVEFLDSERIVYSKKYDFVGTMDTIIKVKIDGKGKKLICPGDFKTNNWKQNKDKVTKKPIGPKYSVLYDEYRYQVRGYEIAYEEEEGKYFTGPRLMFAFDKDEGNFAVHNMETDKEGAADPTAREKDAECFLAALTLKKRNKELTKWG